MLVPTMPADARKTRQKMAIRAAFAAAERPLSPAEALQWARTELPTLSLATVYRNIAALMEEGWLVAVELPGAAPRYEVGGKEHHHHFCCTQCGKLYELEGCEIALTSQLPDGFVMTGHEFFLYGSCAGCDVTSRA
jgi:Fur family transcriptional regulator, ferric uptake regulator